MTVDSRVHPKRLTGPVLWGLAGLGAIVLSLIAAGLFQRDVLNPNGLPQLWRFVRAAASPDLSSELLQVTLQATVTTLAYAVCGTFISVLLGVVGGILGSEVWWLAIVPNRQRQRLPPVWLVMRLLLAIPRAIHELIWGLFFVSLWGLDPLTAILAIALPFGAITAKVFSEILDETPRQSLHVLLNSGVAPPTAFCYSLLPQAFLNLLSYGFYRFECSIRSAAVLGIIGAGGLGYEILLSLQSLRYEQLWTFFYALFGLNGLVDFGSAWLRRRLGCASRLDLNLSRRRSEVAGNSSTQKQALGTRSLDLPLLGIGLLFLIPFCFGFVNPNFSKLWATRTVQMLGDITQSSFPPDWSIVPQLIPLSLETLAMSVLAIALAGLGGMVLAFPAASNQVLSEADSSPKRVHSIGGVSVGLRIVSRVLLLMSRAIPAPIWALVVLFVVFPGILPGAIALGLHNLGILGRLKAEGIENLDARPLQALRSQGIPEPLVFLYGVFPLTLPRFLAYDLYRWEVCMRETVIVGLVGAGGLGRLLTEQLSSFDYRGIVVTLGCFLVLTWVVDGISTMARRSLR